MLSNWLLLCITGLSIGFAFDTIAWSWQFWCIVLINAICLTTLKTRADRKC